MRIFILLTCIVVVKVSAIAQQTETKQNNRIILLADMGNEPDEEQQITHLMVYSNEFDIKGLIAVTGKFLNPQSGDPYKQVVHPELITGIINGYSRVIDNLRKHADGWPEPDYLHSIVASGQPEYGVKGVGPGKSSSGSELIIENLLDEDPRPLYIVVNAGSNTLAQALIDIRDRYDNQVLETAISKLRVFENGAQDDAGAWICSEFPDIEWVRSNYQTYCYGGPSFDSSKGWEDYGKNLGPYTWEPYEYSGVGQHQWVLINVQGDHGPFGKFYPIRYRGNGDIVYLEGGGTIPWMGLIHKGLSDINHPEWGGWSGRFTANKQSNVWSKHNSVKTDEKKYGEFKVYTEAADKWINPENDSVHYNVYTPVWRWRRAMFNDLKCRMDWCMAAYTEANHNPVISINGDSSEKIHFFQSGAGDEVIIDTSESTDPEGDNLNFNWFIYNEAGSYPKEIQLENGNSPRLNFRIPNDASGSTIHIILEVKDNNEIASMYDYRRIVLNVE